jgi:hypothetical protein
VLRNRSRNRNRRNRIILTQEEPEPEPEPRQNGTVPQHWSKGFQIIGGSRTVHDQGKAVSTLSPIKHVLCLVVRVAAKLHEH